ncbi:hypothetical protein NIE79_001391 [Micromonospora sp. NIE79]|uniref:Flavin reductase n=1 Tax=Micromonospora trifolii TaxID=2911208 RepID=A0ABS9N1H6_9ACTN|nr:hypothetical protein [Micromonospora trifolii]MCG5443578.1 hypothetical protein [Micromonospora trifolii]
MATTGVPALGWSACGRTVGRCAGCGQEWPCPDRRRRLLIEYADDRLSLAFYLGLRLADAAADLPGLPADSLHARFLGWARFRPSRSVPGGHQHRGV